MTEKDAYGLCIGGGKLLQALPFMLADENRRAGQDVLPIKVLSISDSAEGRARIEKFKQGGGYDVYVRGFQGGSAIDETRHVDIVAGGFHSNEFDQALADMRAGKIKYITSNTYTGFETSLPPKLLKLLEAAFDAGLEPVPVFALELTSQNGKRLKENVLKLIDEMPGDCKGGFREWVERTHFANTLVDRIVADDDKNPAIPVAEPFALIGIEKPEDRVTTPMENPFGDCKPIEVVDNIIDHETKKLGILNALHTSMVQNWILRGKDPANMTVKQFMDANEEWVDGVRQELVGVVKKMLPRLDPEGLERYSLEVMDRFKNPFYNHYLSEIATNHSVKIDQRLNLVLDANKSFTPPLETPLLSSMMEQTVSARQLEAAKQEVQAKVYGLDSLIGKDALWGQIEPVLQNAVRAEHALPHKGQMVMETVTTKSALQRGLATAKAFLDHRLRSSPDIAADDIVGAYRRNANIAPQVLARSWE